MNRSTKPSLLMSAIAALNDDSGLTTPDCTVMSTKAPIPLL